MKKKINGILLLLIVVFAVYYAFDSHIVGSPSSNGSPFKFYYSDLDKTEKRAYDCILDKIYSMPEKVRVPYLNEEQLDDVFAALLYDNPDLFFIGRKCSLSAGFLTDYFSVEYIMDKQEYAKGAKALEREVQKIISSLTSPDDAWQSELEIHDYIVDKCDYKLDKDNLIYSSAYGALVNGEAACEGYSKAAKLLLDKLKIENGLICGTAKSSDGDITSHMWNVVNINGRFYHLDCTWDDPVNAAGSKLCMYSYFNVSDDMISTSHSEFSRNFYCGSDEENYYIKNGLFFDKFGANEKEILKDKMTQAVNNGEKYVQMRFSNKQVFKNSVSKLVKKGEVYDILAAVKEATGKNISTKVMKYYENELQYILTLIVE